MFCLAGDHPAPELVVGALWTLVQPGSSLARELDPLRPGRGPQPVSTSGTPREALTAIWEQLAVHRNIELSELRLTVDDRAAFDNTLLATWPDRPTLAESEAEVHAEGVRQAEGGRETIVLDYTGRFEELRTLLAPVWPFARRGQLTLTLTLTWRFEPPLPLTDGPLQAYRAALINANQGQIEVRAVPARRAREGGR